MEKWAPVADVFLCFVDMSEDPRLPPRRGPNIATAIDLSDQEHEGHSRGHLRRLWAEFHDVAHLIAAGANFSWQAFHGGDGNVDHRFANEGLAGH